MSYIFYLMGKSSSGKDTLYNKIKECMPELKTITGYTTRPIRANEVDGREYYFVDEKTLEDMEKKGIVIEKRSYQTIHGVWNYFTADDGQVTEKEQNYILIGTLESFCKVRDYYGQDKVLPIYIEVEDGVRLKRALEREMKQEKPKYAELCRRFLADTEDFKEDNIQKSHINKKFINDDLNRCLQEICDYIREKATECGR
ncbi:MAG: guanylate kinase [Lachnospiraceae bacterium]|nr:guanylate kinase [Lachnospiraceae bacterium]